jgi:hypothetical protein
MTSEEFEKDAKENDQKHKSLIKELVCNDMQ